MTMTAKGLAKLNEECGELIQVIGKKLACWDTDEHWDGSNLRQRLIEEMGDVMAALKFVANKWDINEAVKERCDDKFYLFRQWDRDPDNNEHGIDG